MRMLTMIDEFTRECLAIRVGRRMCSEDVLDVLTGWWRQAYDHIRPHSALGYRAPAPEAIEPLPFRRGIFTPMESAALT